MQVSYKDYYEALGVSRNATQEDILKSYRKLARQYHPDLNKGADAEDKFKEINEAYEVLGDPEKRKRYDALGSGMRSGDTFTPPPGWESIFEGFANIGGQGGGFSDFFESLFGGRRSPAGGQQGRSREPGFAGFGASDFKIDGEDLSTELEVSLFDIWEGVSKTVTLSFSAIDSQTGRKGNINRKCVINIPRGVTDGSQIRLAGQGGKGSGGGRDGDLLITLKVRPDPRFTIDQFDLHTSLPISPWEAALGTTLSVNLVSDKIKLNIPPGSPSGKKLRVSNHGLRKKGSTRGDVFLELKIVVPQTLTVAERELFEKLRDLSAFDPRLSS